jgi:LmbE family N-acetylglucosaminyl deacetylase
MNKKVLVIAVHPDDETLGCGGTILKHKDRGDEVYWLILTKANQKISSIKNIELIQKSYVEEVAQEYNFNEIKQLDFITTELDKYPVGELISAISTYIKLIRPDFVYLNHHADVHSDHRIAFDVISSCTKNFRFPFIKRILLYETLSETEFSPVLSKNAFLPNAFNDITLFLEKKIKIMKLFTTEQMPEPFPRAISSIEALARYRGSRIGVKYAEAFMLIFQVI